MYVKADKRVEGRSISPRKVIVDIATRLGDAYAEMLLTSLFTYSNGGTGFVWYTDASLPISLNYADALYAFKVYVVGEG